MEATPNCSHPLASAAGNVSKSELLSLLREEELQEFMLKVPTMVMIILYVFIGIPGNTIVILVYYFRFRSSTTKTFILTLSTFDLVNCVIGLPFEMVDLRFDIELDLPVLCKFFRFFITFCACTATMILISVAIDRFRRICQPFRRQMNVKQSKLVVVGMTLFSFAISAPSLLLYGRRTEVYRGIVLVDCTIDDKWVASRLAKGYQFVMGLLWMLSIVVMCVMYGVIIYNIYRQEKKRLNMISTSISNLTLSKPNSETSSSKLKPSTSSSDNGNFIDTSLPSSPNDKKVVGHFGRSFSKEGEENRQNRNILNRLFSRNPNTVFEEENQASMKILVNSRKTKRKDREQKPVDTSDDFREPSINLPRPVQKNRRVDPLAIQSGNHSSPNDDTAVVCDQPTRHVGHKLCCSMNSLSLNNNVAVKESERSGSCINTREKSSVYVPMSIDSKSSCSNSDRRGFKPVFPPPSTKDFGKELNKILLLQEKETNTHNKKTFGSHHKSSINGYVNYGQASTLGESPVLEKRHWDSIMSKSDQNSALMMNLGNTTPGESLSPRLMGRQLSFNQFDLSMNKRRPTKASISSGRSLKNSFSYSRQHSAASSRQLKASRIAVMMFHVTLAHVLSYLPHLAIQLQRTLAPSFVSQLLCQPVYFIFYHVMLRSIYLNSSINPIIYSYNNGEFRSYCRQLLTQPLSFFHRTRSTPDVAHSASMD